MIEHNNVNDIKKVDIKIKVLEFVKPCYIFEKSYIKV